MVAQSPAVLNREAGARTLLRTDLSDDRAARVSIPSNSNLPTLLRRWRRMAAALDHPAVELTVDEWAPLLALYAELRQAGHAFDPMFTALMGILEREAMAGDGDGDADFTDENSLEDGRFAQARRR